MSEASGRGDAGFREMRSHVDAHDHAVCTYSEPADLEPPLGAFIRDGLTHRELTVFVHSFPEEEEARALLEAAHPGASQLRTDEMVVVSLYRDAFEGALGRIDYEHVTRVVNSLIQRAQSQGRTGTRIFVDASRVYLGGGRGAEWFAFEAWLGRRLQSRVGLVCAYRRDHVMRPDVLPQVLETHAYRFDAPLRK